MHNDASAPRRALALTVAVLTLALGLTACSGGEESAPTTTAAEQQPDQTTESTIPLSTVPDDEFANVVDGLNAQFDSSSDSCALLAVIFGSGSLPTPANPNQSKAAGELLAGVLRRLAENPPPGQEASGPVLATAADGLIAEGEASGWDPATLVNAEAINDEVQAALSSYASACPDVVGGATGGAPAPSDQPPG